MAAAWLAWPGLPRMPATLENRTKRSRSRSAVDRWRCQAPSIFGHSTVSKLSQLWFPRAASDRTPTLWITPASGGRVPVDPRQHGVERGRVRHVRKLDLDPEPAGAQRLESPSPPPRPAPSGHSARPSPAPRSASHSASAHPDAAEPAGHQVGPVGGRSPSVPRGVVVSTIFPMCRAARMKSIAALVSASGHRVCMSGASSPDAMRASTSRRGRPRPRRVVKLQGVEVEDRIGDIRTQRRHLFLAQDVAPRELHEAPALARGRRGSPR